MDQRLSLITLGVGDVTRARAFYEALGWHLDGGVDDETDDVAFFQTPGCILALWDRGKLAVDEGMQVGLGDGRRQQGRRWRRSGRRRRGGGIVRVHRHTTRRMPATGGFAAPPLSRERDSSTSSTEAGSPLRRSPRDRRWSVVDRRPTTASVP